MKNNSSFFERLEQYALKQGVRSVSDLARALGYERPERLYRLQRNTEAKPSFKVIADVANLFVNLNLRWLITGEGAEEIEEELLKVEEPIALYLSKAEGQERLLAEKDKVIDQQQQTIQVLHEAYDHIKIRLQECQQLKEG